jgi:hypothetical protein
MTSSPTIILNHIFDKLPWGDSLAGYEVLFSSNLNRMEVMRGQYSYLIKRLQNDISISDYQQSVPTGRKLCAAAA